MSSRRVLTMTGETVEHFGTHVEHTNDGLERAANHYIRRGGTLWNTLEHIFFIYAHMRIATQTVHAQTSSMARNAMEHVPNCSTNIR